MTTMRHLLACAACALTCHAPARAQAAVPMQSKESFDAAFRTVSTSPHYVLIGVVDDATGRAREVCTTSNFLLGAIDREHGFDGHDWSKAVAVALAAPDHVFHFHKQAALDNLGIRYTEAELAAARAYLAPLSADALRAGFGSLLAGRGVLTAGYARDALACVLLERGLSPRQDDLTGQVYVAPPEAMP